MAQSDRKSVVAWALYDFANSSFTTIRRAWNTRVAGWVLPVLRTTDATQSASSMVRPNGRAARRRTISRATKRAK